MNAQTIPRLFTKQQTANKLLVSRASVDRLARRGELTPIKVGRLVRFSEQDILALLRRSQPHEPLAPRPHPVEPDELEWSR